MLGDKTDLLGVRGFVCHLRRESGEELAVLRVADVRPYVGLALSGQIAQSPDGFVLCGAFREFDELGVPVNHIEDSPAHGIEHACEVAFHGIMRDPLGSLRDRVKQWAGAQDKRIRVHLDDNAVCIAVVVTGIDHALQFAANTLGAVEIDPTVKRSLVVMHPGHFFQPVGELPGNRVALVVEQVNVGERERSTCLLNGERENRQGVLRFSQDGGQSFCAPPGTTPIPPLVNLSRLLHAADHFCRDDENAEDLRLLLAPGSSLGGARPKASVKDKKGNLCMAKFPRHDDEYNVVAWEAVALTLASKAGLQVPRFELEKIADKDVLIVWRFDRTREQRRISYLSAMSMLGARDNEQHSYLEIVDAIRQYGAAPRQDLRQLWQRIAFSIMISNTDDHLRNHGFLQTGGTGWSLSPLFDVNPTPEDIRPRYLNTAIDWEDTSASLDVLRSIAPECGIKTSETNDLLEPIARAVSQWRQAAESFGIGKQEQERMASAFEHKDGYMAVS